MQEFVCVTDVQLRAAVLSRALAELDDVLSTVLKTLCQKFQSDGCRGFVKHVIHNCTKKCLKWIKGLGLKKEVQAMGIARNRLKHAGNTTGIEQTLEDAGRLVTAIAPDRSWPWSEALHELLAGDIDNLKLPLQQITAYQAQSTSHQQQRTRTHIPVPRERNLILRPEINVAETALLHPCARVLVGGMPGVGKDVLAAAVVQSQQIKSLGGVQDWLVGSTDLMFRHG